MSRLYKESTPRTIEAPSSLRRAFAPRRIASRPKHSDPNRLETAALAECNLSDIAGDMLSVPFDGIDQRLYQRTPSPQINACVITEDGVEVPAILVNRSRGGVCFVSNAEFHLGDHVSVAVHYIAGGDNFFQDGRIIRVQRQTSPHMPGLFALEFLMQGAFAMPFDGPPSLWTIPPAESQLHVQ